jgi:nucleoid-associated protein YgaU
MSTTTAARTPRFAPPADPTRTATPRRRTVGHGASIVARADRPVLRIVADGERSAVVTRVLPAPCDAPIRRVALDDFFASEWDGDDVAVEVVRPRPSTLRLTRRGRLVVFAAGLAAALGLGFLAASGSLANDKPEPTRVVTVEPGQTLWDIAASVNDGGDVRSTMAHLEDLNHLDSASLQVGQTLRVPK